MSDPAISVHGIGKRYRIGKRSEQYKRLSETVTDLFAAPFRRLANVGRAAPPEETIWALKEVSFDVQPGEVVGIIGRNGAGKSTLLKVLSRITEPTEGEAVIRGRVGSLLEVGTGFHPELTGRENIFLNGAILGMTRGEIKRKFDEIVAFSEVGKFLDTPVKRYSSGMYVRLAFAVAAHLEPEILLVDEVLAVGDAKFQKKCLGKMGTISSEGRTVLFVSHNMAAVQNICPKAVLLTQGRVLSYGKTEDVIDRYLRQEDDSTVYTTNLVSHPHRRTGSETVLTEVKVFADGNESTTISMGGNLRIETSFARRQDIENMRFGIAVESASGQRLFSVSPSLQSPLLLNESIRRGMISCEIPRFRLLPGLYYLTFIIGSGSKDLDRIDQAIAINVESSDVFQTGYVPESAHGIFFQEADWTVRSF